MSDWGKKGTSLLGVALVSAGVSAGIALWAGTQAPVQGVTQATASAIGQQQASAVQGGWPDFTAAAERSVQGVVHVKSVARGQSIARGQGIPLSPFEFFFGFGGGEFYKPQPRVGAGSGVIISEDGYVLTNNHVIEGADELEVTLNDNRRFTATVVGADAATDIALLKIEAAGLTPIPFGDSDALRIGEWVLAIGNPFNLTSTVTAGIVSAKGRGGITRKGGNIESFFQTDAAVNPGNSGGALVNTRGELVGINTAIYSETGNFAGYSFAVPVSIAGKVAADLREFGTVQRGFLGIQIMDVQYVPQEEQKRLKVTEGAYVAGVAEKSGAREAGIREGDVIVGVNGVTVRSASELQEQIAKFRPEDSVEVKVDRYGEGKKFTVTLQR
jgi:Do/DeqQ family serine protease